MVLKLFPRGFATATSAITTIRARTHTNKQTLNYAAPVLLAGGCLAYAFSGSNDKDKPERSIRAVPTRDLIRGYLVYAACSIPALIDASPAILHAFGSSHIPGLPALANTVVRHTFFAQFVPGETVEECMPILAQMHNQNVGGALNYCAEAEEGELDHTAERDAKELNRCLAECYKGIEELGKLEDQVEAAGGRRGASGFAVKVTGLLDNGVLVRASNTLMRFRSLVPVDDTVPCPGLPTLADEVVVARKPGSTDLVPIFDDSLQPLGRVHNDEYATDDDREILYDMYQKLRHMAELARDRGVKLMMDAEHVETQPVLDAYTLLLCQEFNKPRPGQEFDGPLIYGTFQSYLRRQPQYIRYMLNHARENGYALGMKIVRGAYIDQDRAAWYHEGRPGDDPMWPDKSATDKSYNDAIDYIISDLSSQLASSKPELAPSVVFATHNADSVDTVIDKMQKYGLADSTTDDRLRLKDNVAGKVFVAQLYGMRDDLSDKIVDTFDSRGIPMSLKYVAYGTLAEVVPFLARRAYENKSVMSGSGGAAAERKRIRSELLRRIFGAQ